MSVVSSRIQEQNRTAQLAAQFNQFYLDITLSSITQIGNYRIIKEIGEGAFGKVYLAQHVLLNCEVVLKCGLIDDPNIVREIYYHKQLRHKNVVKLYEVIKTESHLWMVMEYCRGNELYYYIYEKRRLDLEVTQKLFYQIADAMRYVHSLNLAHRDLKLENILMADSKRTIVKLTDFGFVREYNPYKRQFLSTMCGTTAYMAPEVLKNEKYSGFAIDVWSMGVILYAMIYGELPFDSDDEVTTKVKIVNDEPVFKDNIPAEANVLLRKMLSKDPSVRPTVAEILNSPFLIDTTNKMEEKNSSANCNENESIISINQHYKKNCIPFSSKIEKYLLKKMEKLGVDTESLQSAAFSGQCNSLTAFYDLALTYEFQKKKKRYMSKKRYFDAKRQLKRSSLKVKSVLSLSDQMGVSSPTTEREVIRSNSSKLDLTSIRKSLTRRSIDTARPSSLSNGITFQAGIPPGILTSSPMNRTVSFHPADAKSFTSSFTNDGAKPGKVKNIFGKMVFWKRNKMGTSDLHSVPSNSRDARRSLSSGQSDNGIQINLMKSQSPKKLPDYPTKSETDFASSPLSSNKYSGVNADVASTVDSPLPSPLPQENGPMIKTNSQDSYARRQRPDSVVSQASQYSQLSQMYPMSESEFDIGTDLEDDFYDFDGVYESSVNTSQQDLNGRTVLLPQSSTKKKPARPANLRLPSSDNSVVSQSTSATRPKRNQLSLIPTNSSEESSVLSRLGDGISEEGTNTEAGIPRSISPGTKLAHHRHPKLRGFRSSSFNKSSSSKTSNAMVINSRAVFFKPQYNNHMAAPSPVYPNGSHASPRSHSPPIDKTFNKLAINGVIKPFNKVISANKNDGQNSVPMFGINEEEEEEDKDLEANGNVPHELL